MLHAGRRRQSAQRGDSARDDPPLGSLGVDPQHKARSAAVVPVRIIAVRSRSFTLAVAITVTVCPDAAPLGDEFDAWLAPRVRAPGGLPEVAAARQSMSGRPACDVRFGQIRTKVRPPGPHPHLLIFSSSARPCWPPG
jgi:hypothetical protein